MPYTKEQIDAALAALDCYILEPDVCDHCCSTDVAYPYTTEGYLCGDCREALQGTFKNVE